MDYNEIVALGLALPDVREAMSYGTPSLKRNGRFMLRLKEDGEDLAVKLDWPTHDQLLADSPDVFYKTLHYEGHSALLARLALLKPAAAKALVKAAWEVAVPRKR